MRTNLDHYNGSERAPGIFVLVAATLLALSICSFSQTTISTGSIQGIVTDQTGAVVPGAKVSVTNKSTGRVVTVATTSSGAYTSGALTPGDYVVRVETKGFKTTEIPLTVQVGVTT